MTGKEAAAGRTDTASRVIRATPEAIYRTFLDPASVAAWRPPEGMTAEIFSFEGREGGGYRMAFRYRAGGRGKTTEDADVFEGQFAELVPGERIVEVVTFESDDAAFAGEMRVITTLEPVADGTKVTFACENVPPGIGAQEHRAGIESTLANLAGFVE